MEELCKKVLKSWWLTYLTLYLFSLMWISVLIAFALVEFTWDDFLFVFKPMAVVYWFVCAPVTFIVRAFNKAVTKE